MNLGIEEINDITKKSVLNESNHRHPAGVLLVPCHLCESSLSRFMQTKVLTEHSLALTEALLLL